MFAVCLLVSRQCRMIGSMNKEISGLPTGDLHPIRLCPCRAYQEVSPDSYLAGELHLVSAPSEAWRILRGASPRRVRPSQSPVSSVACMAEALPGNLMGITRILKGHWESARPAIHHERHRVSEQDTRSVHRESCRP